MSLVLYEIKDWDDADKALKELSEINRAVTAEESALNQQIDDLKNLSTIKLQPVLARQKELETLLKKYVVKCKKDFAVKRSRELVFGIVGFRQSSSLVLGNVRELVQRLKDEGLCACYKIRETVDKTELGKFKDSFLERLGVERKYRDDFYYTLKAEEIADNGE
jgi:hypothetical protein